MMTLLTLKMTQVVSGRGVVDAYTVGSTEVTATYGTLIGDIEGKTLLTVTNTNLVSIDLQPIGTTTTLGDTFQYTPIGTFDNGETLDLNQSVATKWSPADTRVVMVDGQGSHDVAPGTAYALGVGSTDVIVQYLLIASPPANVIVNP